ncbi:MAG: non-homologous end-joining DNA ligase [Nitrospiraceae bacterium]|nr:non-homologous end-joining DNA ligase [Nitrospiraceae bacterium]
MSRRVVEINGRRLSLANLEKDLYPSYGFTKARILEYYRRIAPYMLPHLQGRALTLKRYPDGVAKEFFFEKRCPSHRPEWVKTAQVAINGAEPIFACVAEDLETLLWAENLASLELHVPLARAATPDRPDAMVFDLDPGEPAGVPESAKVALILRDLLSRMGLESMGKTSGKKGLHVYVPLNRTEATFEQTKTFSRAVAGILQRHYPDLVTANMAKEERRSKVFINWSQNDAKKTMICVYSLRAEERPSVSFPFTWDELEDAVRLADPALLKVLHDEAVRRAEERGDRFRDVLSRAQILPHL